MKTFLNWLRANWKKASLIGVILLTLAVFAIVFWSDIIERSKKMFGFFVPKTTNLFIIAGVIGLLCGLYKSVVWGAVKIIGTDRKIEPRDEKAIRMMARVSLLITGVVSLIILTLLACIMALIQWALSDVESVRAFEVSLGWKISGAILWIVAGSAAWLFLTIRLAWFWFRDVPQIVERWAKEKHWVLKKVEQCYAAIMEGGKFRYGILCLAGHYLSYDERTEGPEAARITKGEDPKKTTGWKRWFEEQFPGYIWVGLAFDGDKGTLQLGKVKIHKLKFVKAKKDAPLEANIIDEGYPTEEWLNVTFPRVMHIPGIETLDGFSLEDLILVSVAVTIPYNTFFGHGGRSYPMIDETLQGDWRAAAQNKTKVTDLYAGTAERTIKDIFFTSSDLTTRKPVRPYDHLGVKVTEITLIDWRTDAGERLLKELQETAVLQARAGVADASVTTFKKEAEAAKELGKKNTQMRLAMEKLAGTDPDVLKAVLLKEGLGEEELAKYAPYLALMKTGVSYLSFDGTGSGQVLIPPPPPAKPEDNNKQREGEPKK